MLPPPSADRAVELTVRREGEAAVVGVGGELDLDNVAPLARALSEAGRDCTGPVVLDLSAVGFADSSTVNVLLQARSVLGARLRIARPSAFLWRLFEVIGLQEALPVYNTVESALARGVHDDAGSGSAGSAVPGGQ